MNLRKMIICLFIFIPLFSQRWEELSSIPIPVNSGGAITWNPKSDSIIYAICGGGNTRIYAYNINQNSWHQLEEAGPPFKSGADLLFLPDLLNEDLLYFTMGDSSQRLWFYNLKTNEVRCLEEIIPYPVVNGSALCGQSFFTTPVFYHHIYLAVGGIGKFLRYENRWDLGTTIIAPACDGIIPNPNPIFDWTEIDGAEAYRSQIAKDFSFKNILLDTIIENTEYSLPFLLEDRIYYWRIAYFANNEWFNWIGPFSFRIITSLPQPPNNATLYTTRPFFDWEDIEGATLYHLQVSQDSLFSTPEVDVFIPISEFQLGFDLLVGKGYYWRYQYEKDGGWSAFTSPFYFEIYKNQVSPPPSDTLYEEVNFDWVASPVAICYQFQIDNLPHFPSPILDTILEISNLKLKLSPGNYYWRVRQKYENGEWQSWSVVPIYEIFLRGHWVELSNTPALNNPGTGLTLFDTLDRKYYPNATKDKVFLSAGSCTPYFFNYIIQRDTWEELEGLEEGYYRFAEGSEIVWNWDCENPLIWAVVRYIDEEDPEDTIWELHYYDINADQWFSVETLPSPYPFTAPGRGITYVRNGNSGYIYYLEGNNSRRFFRYGPIFHLGGGGQARRYISINNKKINIAPNPFTQKATITLFATEKGSLKLYDIAGKLMKELSVIPGEQKIILERGNLKGIYFLKFGKEKLKVIIK